MVTCFPIRMAGVAISISNPRGLWWAPAYFTWSSDFSEDISGGICFPLVQIFLPRRLGVSIPQHLRFERPNAQEAWSYNVLQRLAYLVVIFLCFPLIIWTGLAMSPAFESLAPRATLLGGHQSARTIHFFVTGFLVLFLLVHVLMIILAGFRNRMRAMISGRVVEPEEPV